MVYQTLYGSFIIAMPIIIAYNVYPSILDVPFLIFILCVGIASYVYFIQRRSAQTLLKTLTFLPTEACKQTIEEIVTNVGIPIAHVSFRYAYTQEQIAMCIFNTIIIDPILQSAFTQDPEAQKVMSIYHTHMLPGLTDLQKTRITYIQKALSSKAQLFLVKHELAHALYHYSDKKLTILFATSFIAALCGILVSKSFLSINGLLAISMGVTGGAFADIAFLFTGLSRKLLVNID